MEMLRTFLFEIAGCTSNFTVQNRQQTCISEIREKVGKSKVLVRANVFIYLNYLFSAHYEASLRDNFFKKKAWLLSVKCGSRVGKSKQLNSQIKVFYLK